MGVGEFRGVQPALVRGKEVRFLFVIIFGYQGLWCFLSRCYELGFLLAKWVEEQKHFLRPINFLPPGRKKYHKLSLFLVGENSSCVGWQGFLRILVLLSHKNRTKLPALERIIIPRFPYFQLV